MRRKGFISIFWVAIMMLVTTAIMITATYVYSTFGSTPNDLVIQQFQRYYDAELGLGCAKWLMDKGIPVITIVGIPWAPPGNPFATATTNQVNINITWNGGNSYTLTSTCTSGGTRVTLRADYDSSTDLITRIY